MDLSQDDINELYSMACNVAKRNTYVINKEQTKKQIYYGMRYFYVNRHGHLRGISHEYRKHKFYDLFKNHNYFSPSFGTMLDKGAIMLEKIMDKVAQEHCHQEENLWCELRASIDDMDECVAKMKQVNEQGMIIAKDLAKVPEFLETGKWAQ